jgi:hypothetical protein
VTWTWHLESTQLAVAERLMIRVDSSASTCQRGRPKKLSSQESAERH